MIKINRELVYTKQFQESLQRLMNLKLRLEDAAFCGMVYFKVKNLTHEIKTPLYLQVMNWGGEVLGDNKKPPYYQFNDEAMKEEFEIYLKSYLSQDEEIEGFDVAEIQVLEEQFNTLASQDPVNLQGALTIKKVPEFTL